MSTAKTDAEEVDNIYGNFNVPLDLVEGDTWRIEMNMGGQVMEFDEEVYFEDGTSTGLPSGVTGEFLMLHYNTLHIDIYHQHNWDVSGEYATFNSSTNDCWIMYDASSIPDPIPSVEITLTKVQS